MLRAALRAEVAQRALAVTRRRTGLVGPLLLVIIVGVAFVGPLVAPHPFDEPIGLPYSRPTAGAPLGTDFLGRDVLSRVLWGGRSVVGLAGAATLLAYLVGGMIGLVAGYVRSLLDAFLMRAVDVVLSFPALLFMLILVTAAGTGEATLVLGIAVIQAPAIARVVRTATLEQAVRGYVEAAVTRGERTRHILWREILPNIVAPTTADAGLRFTYSVILVASVNFLGLGLQPPHPDWALMISENRSGLSLNPWMVLAPAALIALLTISTNAVGDALARSLGRSQPEAVG